MPANDSFGTYLRERRIRLDPAALGYASSRRRTPGLRREEVAQRAGISTTWYSWLEQGRGGPPSIHALDRLAEALMLTAVEREHLFLLAVSRPPEIRYQPPGGVTPRLQHVLDALDACPAMIRTATWDVVAWNRAEAAVFTDYGTLPAAERNVLRLIFLDPGRARSMSTGRASHASLSAFSAAMRPAPARLRPCSRWWRSCATLSSARSCLSFRRLRSTAGQTSPCWSTRPSHPTTRRGSGRLPQPTPAELKRVTSSRMS